jgi:hypothetical protein
MSLFRHCGECSAEKDCDWCEICSSFVCDDCDEAHDCLATLLLDDVDEERDTPH